MSDWVTHLMDAARERGWTNEQTPIFRAFDRDDRDIGTSSLAETRRALDAPIDVLHTLVPEVDAGQAAMFERRLTSVLGLCQTLGHDGILLETYLRGRLREILAGAPPRALRVRALADFVYSQAARFLHADRPKRSYAEHVAGAEWRTVGEGVRHTRLEGAGPVGPLFVNLLEVRQRRLHVLDTRPQGDLVEICRDHGAIAGVSGGFFLYSEPGLGPLGARTDPVGLLVSDGRVHNPPVFPRGALVQRPNGALHLGPLGLRDGILRIGDRVVSADQITTRATANQADTDGLQIVGLRVVGEGREVPVGGLHVRGHAPGPVSFTPHVPIQAGIAGGPMLLAPTGPVRDLDAEGFTADAPPITFSRDETYDQNLLPRMGVGLCEDGRLVFAAVDGRDPYNAPGTTLRGLAELLSAVGATTALNLDGGSSKRMVVDGIKVCRSSTEVGATGPGRLRPVHSAILVL